ncbi:MAG: hypothetical protein N2442_05680 [Spirochaetes bacterium]|nr:hypothetical protein [Spirochaetota bacterium]
MERSCFRGSVRIIRNQLWWMVLSFGLEILVSCGLETYTYLYPLNTDTIYSDPTVGYYKFTHNTDNDLDEFLGYEIFYKFYTPDSSEILSDRSSLENVYLATESPITVKRFSRLRLKRLSDHRLFDTRPLLEIPMEQRGTPWVFKFDFSPLLKTPKEPPVLIWYQSDGTTEITRFTLLRSSRLEAKEEETFVPDQFLETDPDVTSMNVTNIVQAKGRIAVVFAIAGFGRKLDTTPIYSNVIFLNRSSSTNDVLVIDLRQ